MIKFGFRRPPGFNNLAQKYDRQIRERLMADLTRALRLMQEAILETPVYTGKTLVNYRWSLGSPTGGVRQPVKDPALPGKTSDKKIGTEPRRRANANIVKEEFAEMIGDLRASKNPFQTVYLTNDTPYFLEIEYGTYAVKDGHTSRTPPGGMVRRGESMVLASLSSLRKKGGV